MSDLYRVLEQAVASPVDSVCLDLPFLIHNRDTFHPYGDIVVPYHPIEGLITFAINDDLWDRSWE